MEKEKKKKKKKFSIKSSLMHIHTHTHLYKKVSKLFYFLFIICRLINKFFFVCYITFSKDHQTRKSFSQQPMTTETQKKIYFEAKIFLPFFIKRVKTREREKSKFCYLSILFIAFD